jgi:3-oxoacyl-[acyl-carrier protein] reductase
VNLELAGKGFVVGGGSKGLGRAVAEALLAEGARVLLVSRNPEEAAAELGENAFAFAGDIASPADVERLAAEAKGILGRLDGILVNHGGPPAGDVLDLTDEQWEQAFQLVVAGPIRLLRALVPQLEDGSAVLFVTSASVRQPIPGLDTSNVLRPGVAAMVKCLAREHAPRVRFNSLAPGRYDTDRVRHLDRLRAESTGTTEDEQREAATKTIPLGRYGDPAELGRVGAFLLSPAASYVTGAAIQADGGLVTAVP